MKKIVAPLHGKMSKKFMNTSECRSLCAAFAGPFGGCVQLPSYRFYLQPPASTA
jgi:hypothetical protein